VNSAELLAQLDAVVGLKGATTCANLSSSTSTSTTKSTNRRSSSNLEEVVVEVL